MQSEPSLMESRKERLTRIRAEESQSPLLETAPYRAELHALYAENIERIRRGTTGGASKARFCAAALSSEAFEELVDRLEYREVASYRAIAVVAWILGQARLSIGQKNRVGAALRRIVQERNSKIGASSGGRTRFVLAPSIALAALGCLFAFAMNFMPRFTFAPLVQRAIYLLSPLAGSLLYLVRRRAMATQRRDVAISALRTLHKFAQPESLMCFCEASSDPSLAKIVEKALLATLPQLTSEMYERLDPNLTKELCDLMLDCTPGHPPLIAALVEALEKVGSKDAIRPLRRAMALIERGESSQAKSLKASVERALKVVGERAILEEAAEAEQDASNNEPHFD